jgi:hypothetical protein
MADERLVQGLTAWLRDSDVPPPDALMSASRVMAGVETTPRLGRLWPPARMVPTVEPAPALGAFGPEGPPSRPVPRVQKPRIKARLRDTLTPIRLLAIGTVVALTCSVALVVASMLPSGSPPEPASAAVAPASAAPVAPVAPVASAAPVAPVGTAPLVQPKPTLRPQPAQPAAPTWAQTDRPLDWHTESVRLETAAMTLSVGKRTFTAPADMRPTGSLSPRRTSLRGGWVEDGVEQRLVIQIARDEDAWWVARIRTYDGRARSGWIDYKGLADRTRTPLGEPWTGDLTVASSGAERKALRQPGAATLTFEELRLSAFGPDGSLAEE